MRIILLTLLSSLFFSFANSQVTFSNVEFETKTEPGKNGTEILCFNSTFSIKFQLTQKSVELQNNIAIVDSQPIQIAPLAVNGIKKALPNLSISEQKQLLSDYSKYELDYFSNELNIEVINSSNQWIKSKSRYWFLWYFRVGNSPTSIEVEKRTEFQLFASTIVAGKLLTINAPILTGGDFTKAGLIVNQMMESLVNNIQSKKK